MEVDPVMKKGTSQIYFPFLGAYVLGFLGRVGQQHFWGLENIIILEFLLSMEIQEPRLRLWVNPQYCKLSTYQSIHVLML